MSSPTDSGREPRRFKSLPRREVSGETYPSPATPDNEPECFRFKDLPASLVNGGFLYRQRAAEIILSCPDEAKAAKFAALNRYDPNWADPLAASTAPAEARAPDAPSFTCPSDVSLSDHEDTQSLGNKKKRKSVRSIDVPSSHRLILPRQRKPYSSHPSATLRSRFKLKYKLRRFRTPPDEPKKPAKRPSKAEKRVRALRGPKLLQRKRSEVPSTTFDFAVASPIASGLEKLREQMEGLQVASDPPPQGKMSRRKKATLNNVHHRTNYVPSRVPSGGAKKEHQPESNVGLFGGEWTCLFCEYELLYGEPPLMLRACRNRKKQIQRRRKKGEAPPVKDEHERCSCGNALDDDHCHDDFAPVFDAMKKDKQSHAAIAKYITTGGKSQPPPATTNATTAARTTATTTTTTK